MIVCWLAGPAGAVEMHRQFVMEQFDYSILFAWVVLGLIAGMLARRMTGPGTALAMPVALAVGAVAAVLCGYVSLEALGATRPCSEPLEAGGGTTFNCGPAPGALPSLAASSIGAFVVALLVALVRRPR